MNYQRIYKFLFSLFCALSLLVNACSYSLASSYAPSSWAQSIVSLANSYKIVPENTSDIPYTQDISRKEFCHYAISLYTVLTGNKKPDTLKSHFVDTNDTNILYASDLGIMTGRGDGIFSPNDSITRQEMSIVITRLLSICDINTVVSSSQADIELKNYTDANSIKSWAINPFAFCIKNDIIKGMSETQLCPDYHTTREQAIVIIYRCFDKFATDEQKNNLALDAGLNADGNYELLKATIYGDAKLISYNDRTLNIEFSKSKTASRYKVDIWLDNSNFWYSDEDVYVKTIYTDANNFTFENVRIGKNYKINIYDDADNHLYTASAFVSPLYSLEEKHNIVFSNGEIESEKSAYNSMEKIVVDVWRIGNNGEKYPAKASLLIHKSIANITKDVFREIFKSKSQFPIKDISAYSWRYIMSSGRYSHHNYGTAIDINANENYCLYTNGTYVGVGWFPGENIYSIAPDGDIVSIFSKYGFIWGGDEWSNPKDYMHFSYLEL